MSLTINGKNILKVLVAIAIAYCYAYLISSAYIYTPFIPQPPEWFKSIFGKSPSGYGPSSYVYPWLKFINTIVVFIVAFPVGIIVSKVFKKKAYIHGLIGSLILLIYSEISNYCIVSTIIADKYKVLVVLLHIVSRHFLGGLQYLTLLCLLERYS